jgi:hypothetical protein
MSLLDSTSSLPSNSSNNNTSTDSPHNDTNAPSTSLTDQTPLVSKDADLSTTLSLRLSDPATTTATTATTTTATTTTTTTTTTASQGSGLDTSYIASSNSSTNSSSATNMTGLLISNQSNSSTTVTSDIRPLQGIAGSSSSVRNFKVLYDPFLDASKTKNTGIMCRYQDDLTEEVG